MKSFRFLILRALLILLWDVQQRNWPHLCGAGDPKDVMRVTADIQAYIAENQP